MSKYTQTMEQIVLAEEKKEVLRNLNRTKAKKRPFVRRITARAAVAAAACAALVFTSVAVRYQNTKDASLFTVSVLAAELSDQNTAAYISDRVGSALDIGMQWNDADGMCDIDYSIHTPITCEGTDIASVTYSITGAYFQILTTPEDTLVMEKADNTVPAEAAVAAGEGEPQYCTSYTVDYENQTVDGRYVNVFRTLTMPNAHAQELNGRESTVEQNAEFYSEMLNGVEITCTVTMQDGTTASQVLGMEGTVMKNKDTGLTYDWQTLYPEEEDAYIMIRTIDGK